MPEDLSGTYEVVVPVTLDVADGPVLAGKTVNLSHEDAEAFLARGFVKEPEGGEQETPENPGLASLDAATHNLLVEAGFDTDEKVSSAVDEALLDVEDIGTGRLANIRRALPREEA